MMKELVKSPVVFDEATHTYTLNGVLLQGVTSTLIHRAFPDKYKEVSEEVLAEAARKGHELHSSIEYHDNFEQPFTSENERINLYDSLKQENGLHVIANEYLVSDLQHYASQIDAVMENQNQEICLVDFKTTYNLDKASTGLQLSIYKRFFEQQNPGLKVVHIYAFWLPNKDHSIAECHELSIVDDETIDALIEADLKDEPFQFELIPDEWSDLERQYRYWSRMQEEAANNVASVKERMMQVMQLCNISTVRTDAFTVSYIPSKTSKRFDSALFKKENADLYKSYMKETETAASLRVLSKKQEDK